MHKDKQINVTQPSLPDLDEFVVYLEKIWKSKLLTNEGPFHQQLEKKLCDYLGVKYISLFANGTLALLTALQELKIKGEVITTPYSFVATTHALWWNKIKPVFVDIDPLDCNLDPDKIEAAITPKTTAILPVHVYGNPCKMESIKQIAEAYNLEVIYDAAHAFGVKYHGQSVLEFGDLSVLSFHATKVFNTFEGGAIISHDERTKRHIDDLKNFGFRGETTVIGPGINAKMNEIQAAMGLLQLKYIDQAIVKRKEITRQYREQLTGISGISFLEDQPGVKHCYAYFPIFLKEKEYGISRDQLYNKMKDHNIFGRRYFYPLISQFPTYRGLVSALPGKMPVAEQITGEVICLPIYPDLEMDVIQRITGIIRNP